MRHSAAYLDAYAFKFGAYSEPNALTSVRLSRGKGLIQLVRARGLEPPRHCWQQILSLPRLPFRHAR